MNTIVVIGRLTRDPDFKVKARPSGDDLKVCNLRIAADTMRKDEPLFIDVETFGRQAEVCAEHLSKGRLIGVTGELRYREWIVEGSDQKRHAYSINAERVRFLGGKPDTETEKGQPDLKAA